MTRLDLAAQHPILPLVAQVVLVYLASLAGVLAATVAWRERPAYWLAVAGIFSFLVGGLWGRGVLSGGASFTAIGAGIALVIFGVAIDLLFGPPFTTK